MSHTFVRCCLNLIPITLGERLFLNIIEDDFIFDGYGVFRIKDVTNIKIKDDICNQIITKEGLLKEINVPEIIIENWKTVFESLKAMEINIIIEKKPINDADSKFIIGRIDKIFKKFAYVWSFDADGIWEDEPIRVPYSEITNIIFSSRYVTVFSKYIEEPPHLL